ncbi:bifunctional aspartate kinase/homoserine dehydrogenase I [Prosthecochloris sp. SCSIO W1101]|uniref:bifunctional aspartate kinase/homoserine dehydrogenase I n=1 Tax=Prosthecochloris sp. SCSIO W1101 TaxID=2992242 RepID=UPI00223DCECC|nr:bifunctional aspartate kinase/homoserine dehydrogenase I [Prosthecochloris sp. SCSIO W1101]UZJ41224.1 bifunctional aspartate kinase/homoserine dehydrogenase I [Prosthecochloris sp. SCSIO W1101]
MSMKVLKFGGTSIQDGDRIRNVLGIIRRTMQDTPVIVVVSAIRKVTDLLLEAAVMASDGDVGYSKKLGEIETLHRELVEDLIETAGRKDVEEYLQTELTELGDVLHGVCLLHELSDKSSALIMSFGERFSAWIISSFLRQEGIEASYVDARNMIVTDSNHCDARVDMKASRRLIRAWFKGVGGVPVVTGYIGAAPDGTATTLGRGGSDYTATIIGASVGVDKIEIWTDVDGFFSADPKRVRDAYALPFISYSEAMELSHSGAKVLHPYSVHPAMKAGIPISIRNSYNPDAEGTRIGMPEKSETVPERPVTGLSSINNVVLLNLSGSGMVGVPGIASRLFSCLAGHMINIIFISQASSEQSISLVINLAQAEKARRILEEEFAVEIAARQIESLTLRRHIAIIAVVGNDMSGHPGVSAHLFETLGKNGINVIAVAQGANEMNISFVVDSRDEDKALNCVHESFLLSRRTVHVFIAGTGTIAKSLIGQLRDHTYTLRKEMELDVVVCGMANTRMMAVKDGGIDLRNWEKALKPREDGKTIKNYIERIKARNLHNSIFVDCTASGEVAESYPDLLASNISIVTANKLGVAGSWALYETIRDAQHSSNARFLYETNVGAGLPIINTLNDLRNSGDKIIKIEGVLSGTLSYIFNELRKGGKFSDIVSQAKGAGYTEPDPREDLSGADFARKFLILGRELGYRLDYEDIECESLVPEHLRTDMSVDTFMEKLSSADAGYDEKIRKAAENDMTIAYAGEISEGKARISVKMLPLSSPVAGLNGTENMVVFTTDRYLDTPLVVKGPGAGGEVTAGGVFADILRIASYLV